MAAPISGAIEHLADFNVEDIIFDSSDAPIGSEEYLEVTKEAFEEGVARLVSEKYGISLNDMQVVAFDFEFKEVLAEYEDINYIGYYIKNLGGYYLSSDRSNICSENNECELSTKYLDDGETIYYTVINYFINSKVSMDMLLFKEDEVFPFYLNDL